MRTLFHGWPLMVNDTHTRRRSTNEFPVSYSTCRGCRENIATRFGIETLEWCRYLMVKKVCDNIYSFWYNAWMWRTPSKTYGQTSHQSIGHAYTYHHAAKTKVSLKSDDAFLQVSFTYIRQMSNCTVHCSNQWINQMLYNHYLISVLNMITNTCHYFSNVYHFILSANINNLSTPIQDKLALSK